MLPWVDFSSIELGQQTGLYWPTVLSSVKCDMWYPEIVKV